VEESSHEVRSLIVLSLGALLVGTALALYDAGKVGSIQAAEAEAKEKNERHPHIHGAIKELREAKKELETSTGMSSGRRPPAISFARPNAPPPQ
jgi:hypothetical protein